MDDKTKYAPPADDTPPADPPAADPPGLNAIVELVHGHGANTVCINGVEYHANKHGIFKLPMHAVVRARGVGMVLDHPEKKA
jgi:hypothetical protein